MKYLLGFVLVALASLQVKATELIPLTCEMYEQEARDVMTYRQRDDASLAEALEGLENIVSELLKEGTDPEKVSTIRERIRWLIVDTFKEMQFSTKSGKQRKINQYANEQMLLCMELGGEW